jgi:hypothetical protein
MLTSPRKICKLFIKFVIYGKYTKAETLLQHYPEYSSIIPWQKAFTEALQQQAYNVCNWIIEKSEILHFTLDIQSYKIVK